jgi:c-di-GMP-binding flagellar brake protein YcgR
VNWRKGNDFIRMLAVMAMESEEKAAELERENQSRRTAPRHGVDVEAHLLLVSHGSKIPCRIVDLSLGGCCLHAKERFTAGSMARVEVNFKVRGLAFRFSGLTQWTDGQHLVGIRFVDVPLRRREELVEALSEVEAENAAKAAQKAAEKRVAEEQAVAREAAAASVEQQAEEKAQRQTPVQIPALAIVARVPPLQGALPVLPRAAKPQLVEPQEAKAQAAGPSQAKPTGRDRREALREEVDTSVVIFLVNVASRLQGRILDLSLGGCRIRADERFPVGIYTRVEIEFHLAGLPFRLGGVVQAIHDRDRRNIGIRFLDMSSRKREQVEELIEDIQKMREQRIENRE